MPVRAGNTNRRGFDHPSSIYPIRYRLFELTKNRCRGANAPLLFELHR